MSAAVFSFDTYKVRNFRRNPLPNLHEDFKALIEAEDRVQRRWDAWDVVLEPGEAFEPMVEFLPTDARPGSEEKIEVMEQRYNSGLPLFHPADNNRHVVRVGVAGGYGQFEKVVPEGEDDDDEDGD